MVLVSSKRFCLFCIFIDIHFSFLFIVFYQQDLPLLAVLKKSCYYKANWAKWTRFCTGNKYSHKFSTPLKNI